MLEKIRNSKDSKLAKVILVIIIIPFALFGIDSYLSSITTNNYVAKVNGQELSLQQYQRTEDIIRQQMTDANTDPSLFESNQFRQAVVDNMVSTELISQAIHDYGFSISDEQLRDYIVGMPDFQVNGKFSQDRYDEIVRYNNISPKQLEEKIRNDLAGQQIRDSLNNLIYTPDEVIQPLVNLAYQKRDISLYEIYLDDYKDKVKPTDDQMKKFYEDNKTSFTRPDQVKIEFIIYSVAGLVPKTVITDEEVKEFYAANKDSFQSNQERKAKHILFAFKSDMTESDKVNLKQEAEKTLEAVKKDPKTFEAKAKELSQDPESAKRGGDLGFFARGVMVKPFEDTVFNMNKGDISDIVETDFGYHIIMLSDIRGEEVTFDSLKAQIKGQMLYGKALEKYASNVDSFSNDVYENSDNLSFAAKKYDLEIQTSEWLSIDDAKRFLITMPLRNQFLAQSH